jgi:PleD family two-component response regulator
MGREALLHDADQALYVAKAAGRNRVESAPVALAATQNGN